MVAEQCFINFEQQCLDIDGKIYLKRNIESKIWIISRIQGNPHFKPSHLIYFVLKHAVVKNNFLLHNANTSTFFEKSPQLKI